jgi:hypothetical protein
MVGILIISKIVNITICRIGRVPFVSSLSLLLME